MQDERPSPTADDAWDRIMLRNEEWLRMALDAARIIAWEWTPSTGSLRVSGNASELYGLADGQTLASIEQARTLTHPDDVAEHRSAHERAINAGGLYRIQYRLIRPSDGSQLWIEERGQVVHDITHGTRLFGVACDITGRKQAEAERAAAADFQRLIFESVKDFSIFTTDLAGIITTWNQGAENVFGYSESETIGRPAAMVFTTEDRAAGIPAQELRIAAETGSSSDERWHLRKDGRRLFASGMVRPIRDDRGELIGFTKVARDVTGHKQAEAEHRAADEALALSERRFRALIDAGSDAVYRMSPDWSEMYSLLSQEFITATAEPDRAWIEKYIHPDDRPQVRAAIAGAVASGTVFELEHRVLRTDGTLGWTHSRATPILDAGGRIVEWYGMASDITDRKDAQELIGRSEERYRTLFEAVGEGFCILRLQFDEHGLPVDYCFLEINPAFEQITRLRDATGRCVSEVLPDLDRGWFERYGRIARTGIAERFEIVEPSMEGRSFHVHAFRVGSPDEHKVAVLFNDITDRKNAEQAIHRQADRLQKLAEISVRLTDAHDVNSVLGIVTEAARGLIPAHHAATTMLLDFRYPRTISVFSHSAERHEAIDQPNIDGLALYEAMQQANQPIRLTTAQLDADPRWAMLGKIVAADPTLNGWLAAPLVGHDGRSMGLLQLSDRLDGQFTVDDEAILIQLARITSIAVENARLYEELRGNDRRKDEFLAMLAHELRNPLGAIASAVHLMQAARKPEKLPELHETIQHQIKHLTHLIDDLLDVSRITQNKIELRMETIELTAIVREAAELAQPQLDERRHELTMSIPGRAVAFVADPTRVEQMLSNLLTNAAKYSEPGRSIHLAAKAEGDEVVFRVRDQGYGITAEMLPRIFGLFTQVDATLDRSRGGLGIGLTLVKNLAEMHGGSIVAASAGKDMGSEFTLRLPIGRPTVPASPGVTPPAPAAVPTAITNQRILIIDDNRDMARMTSELLDGRGFEMRLAHDGYEGIEAAKAFEPHAVLLDIGLPGMNGYDVAAAIRNHECCRKSVLVAISGYGEPAARERSKAVGIDHHLTKPLDFDQLDAILEGL